MITEAILAKAAALVAREGFGDACVSVLRKEWPGLRFVACSEDDIPARLSPAFEADGFNLYLVGGGEHCLALSQDADSAIGIVVASVED
ncbi:MAG: hypothetical protein CVU19_15315 [Betaproteobacteria bacterium HGW-Betaproteobacteria-13]|jgi:hypothetical protein|nr:MAG: hypothetical protein CVU25_11740 [Betaproteobacteria bacterium HGW-Betaproteobacteria-19]PKO79886.1 MAG: hypothetical protein CVU19_15315 [Betaproteobacteria bacterium HGW-Betaproteobacteria-13]